MKEENEKRQNKYKKRNYINRNGYCGLRNSQKRACQDFFIVQDYYDISNQINLSEEIEEINSVNHSRR